MLRLQSGCTGHDMCSGQVAEKEYKNEQKPISTYTPHTKVSALLPELAVFQGPAIAVSGHQSKYLQNFPEIISEPHHRLPSRSCSASSYL